MTAQAQSYSILFSAFLSLTGATVPQGYAVTRIVGGTYAVATTANLAVSISGTIDGVALELGNPGRSIQVQRDAEIAPGLVPWLGAGSLENAVVASDGKVQRASVAAGTVIGTVTKDGGVKLTPSGAIGGTIAGDVTGTLASATVVKLRGTPVSATAPSTGNALVFDGSNWVPGSAGSTIAWANDLAGSIDSSQKVVALTGATNDVSMKANSLTWGAATTALITQNQATSGAGKYFHVRAQGAATGSNGLGGQVAFTAGKSDGSSFGTAQYFLFGTELVHGAAPNDFPNYFSYGLIWGNQNTGVCGLSLGGGTNGTGAGVAGTQVASVAALSVASHTYVSLDVENDAIGGALAEAKLKNCWDDPFRIDDEVALDLKFTTNQSTGNDTAFRITRTDTASPGTSRYIDIRDGLTRRWSLLQDGSGNAAAAFGASPAVAGNIRFQNATNALAARNADNSADLALLTTDASDAATFGNGTGASKLAGSTVNLSAGGSVNQFALTTTLGTITVPLAFSATNPAASGDLRLAWDGSAHTVLAMRNSGNTADIPILATSGVGSLVLGNSAYTLTEIDGLTARLKSTTGGSIGVTGSTSTGTVNVNTQTILWNLITPSPTITQTAWTSDVAAQAMTIHAQDAYASAVTNTTGGKLILAGGVPAVAEASKGGNIEFWVRGSRNAYWNGLNSNLVWDKASSNPQINHDDITTSGPVPSYFTVRAQGRVIGADNGTGGTLYLQGGGGLNAANGPIDIDNGNFVVGGYTVPRVDFGTVATTGMREEIYTTSTTATTANSVIATIPVDLSKSTYIVVVIRGQRTAGGTDHYTGEIRRSFYNAAGTVTASTTASAVSNEFLSSATASPNFNTISNNVQVRVTPWTASNINWTCIVTTYTRA